MQVAARLSKLERSLGMAHPLEAIPRPKECPAKLWRRALELLSGSPPDVLHPYSSLEDVIDHCAEWPPHQLADYPEPLIDAVVRACQEAELGELPPDRFTRARDELARLPQWPAEKLREFLAVMHDYGCRLRLPPPYSTDHLTCSTWPQADALADRLERREMTADEHAAALEPLLPMLGRADLEQAARRILKALAETAAAAPAMP